ncbi:MAG: hypothetical protein ACREV7_12770 [Steroidobacteraceae bacterium]
MTTRTQGSRLHFCVHENRRHHGILLYELLQLADAGKLVIFYAELPIEFGVTGNDG